MDATGFARSLIGARCIVCGSGGSVLCDECAGELVPPLEDAPIPGLSKVIAPWRYEGAARRLILDLKLRALAGASVPLAEAMANEVRAAGSGATTVTWVPGKRADMRRRGFDHAERLARGVSQRIGMPAIPLLERVGKPLDQAGLSATQRHENLRGAFRARACSGVILLVDDLVTTGATATACARALKAAGARRVELLAVCRV